jgi:apolipoprotein N-acyltransferase
VITRPWGWWVFLIVLICGAFAAFGQAPYDVPILMLLGFAVSLRIYRDVKSAKSAAYLGWALGTGYFCHALQWIVSPFMVDAARHGWMAPFALVLLAGGLALFWALAFGVARRLSISHSWPLLLTWSAVELIRGYIFTGFPWAMPSQVLVSSLLGQGLAWFGPYAMNAVIIAVAIFISRPIAVPLTRVSSIAAAGVFAALVLMPPLAGPAALTEHSIRLVQPNAAQRDKWNPDLIPVFFDRQLGYTAALPAPGKQFPDLILWSETAIPWPLDLAEPALAQIAQAAGSSIVALGVQRRDADNFYNSMVVLDSVGAVTALYDKHHLVPFGEYMPFSDLMSKWGIFGLAARLAGGYTAGEGAQMLDFGALGKALPLICYEAVFPHDVNAAPERADFIIQITNDAWFGIGAGPKQHLAQARMRAIEQGLPLARTANTGISAMIDPYGRVIASLGLNEAGFVDAPLPAPLAPTLYSRTGDFPLALVLLLGCVAGVVMRRKV